MMNRQTKIASLILRLSLAATFLSAVASRLGLWGEQSSEWENFLIYASQVLSYVPDLLIPYFAVGATTLETAFSLLLITGYKTRIAAYGAAFITLVFALSMAYSFGVKSPLDYSVFAFSAGAFLLATLPAYPWSLDQFLKR